MSVAATPPYPLSHMRLPVRLPCPACSGYQQLLPIGGFDPAYFEGATYILATACRQDFQPCVPGETSKPSGR